MPASIRPTTAESVKQKGPGSRLYSWPFQTYSSMSQAHQPHLLYPQFKQVAHPSMITSALVLHLWHIVALGGKLVPSPVTSTSSSWWEDVATEPSPSRPSPAGAGEGAAATSGFFFERASYCLRFSAIRAFWAALICGSWSRPIDLRCSSTIEPSSATSEGMYTPPALK